MNWEDRDGLDTVVGILLGILLCIAVTAALVGIAGGLHYAIAR